MNIFTPRASIACSPAARRTQVAGFLLLQVVWSNGYAHWGFSCFYALCLKWKAMECFTSTACRAQTTHDHTTADVRVLWQCCGRASEGSLRSSTTPAAPEGGSLRREAIFSRVQDDQDVKTVKRLSPFPTVGAFRRQE